MDYPFRSSKNDRIDEGTIANVFSAMSLFFHGDKMEGKSSRFFRMIYPGPEKLLSAVTSLFTLHLDEPAKKQSLFKTQ